MAKSIFICSRVSFTDNAEEHMRAVCNRLEPDNITPPEPKIFIRGDIAYGVMNPNSMLSYSDSSLMMGSIYGNKDDWHVPFNDFPDGSYAIFRNDNDYCEIVADKVASRNIWYYYDENIFIASTSLRAIIMYLGTFEFDHRVIPWMLSTGTLGPGFSWDARVKRVTPDSSVILNKKKWSVTLKISPVEFKPVTRSDKQNEVLLREAIKKTFNEIIPDYNSWILPLSGGYDSRGILCFLLEANSGNKALRTVTWGLRSSLESKGNDARVAEKLAGRLNVSNTYLVNDLSDEPVEKILDRFVHNGEGLTDNISDYLDGFKMWKEFFEHGVECIIRGDEGFGCKPYSSELAARMNQGLTLCSDLSNLKDYEKFGFPRQELPEYLKKRKNETLSSWRDRLYHTHTLSTECAALSDLKLPYTEQINPLLSGRILDRVRQLPDHLRTGKALFKRIVDSFSLRIEYAKNASSAPRNEILKQNKVVDLLIKELSSDEAKELMPPQFLNFVIGGIVSGSSNDILSANKFTLRTLVGKITPRFLKEGLRKKIILHGLDNHILAFRAYLVYKMSKVLSSDRLCFHK